jgi:hypothetical protein
MTSATQCVKFSKRERLGHWAAQKRYTNLALGGAGEVGEDFLDLMPKVSLKDKRV